MRMLPDFRANPPSRARRAVLLLAVWVAVMGGISNGPVNGQDAPTGNAPTTAEFGTAKNPDERAKPPEQASSAHAIELDGKQIYFYECRHKDAVTLKKYVEWLIPNIPYLFPYGAQNTDVSTAAGRSVARGANETLIVEDTPERIKRILQVLRKLDVPRPQVLIDARVLEIQSSRSFELGFNFNLDRTGVTNAFFQGFDLNYDPSAFLEALPTTQPPEFQGMNLLLNNTWDPSGRSAKEFGLSSVAIRALQQNNQAEILANPRLLVEEDSMARVFSGEDVYIQEITSPGPGVVTIRNRAKNAGITLDIRPLLISRHAVKLHLVPSVKDITGFTTPSESGVSNPIIASRTADTLATVEDGKTLVIGGLILNENRIETRGIPLLADLPLVGELFRNHRRIRSRSEVIFTITPYILREGNPELAPLPTEGPFAAEEFGR